MASVDTLQPARVLVLHRESIVAFGLCATLAQEPGIDVQQGIGSQTSADRFDVVICDHETGMALSQPARGRNGSTMHQGPRILVLTAQSSERAVRQALDRGVHGYVLLESPIEELVRAVLAVCRGQRYLSPAVALRMADSLTHESLTSRESEVLMLLAAGQCNKTIARQLQIAVGTVKAHVKAIMGKLGASSRTQAVSVAAQRGLVGLGIESPSRHSVEAIWPREQALAFAA